MSTGTKTEPSGERPAPGRAPGSAEWIRVLQAGVQAQRLVPGAICVGGTAAALYAGHRLSHDTDHVLIPTWDEMVCMKAFLAYDRNATRDYLDFAAPFDLDAAELPHYRGLDAKWHRWETTRDICRRFGVLLGESLVRGGT